MTCADRPCRWADLDDRAASLVSWTLGIDLVPVRQIDELAISRTGDDEVLLRCRHTDPSGAVLDLAVRGRRARVQEFFETGRLGIAVRTLRAVTVGDDGSLLVADDNGTPTWLPPVESELPMWPAAEALPDVPVPALDGEDRLFRVEVGLPQALAAGDFAVRWVVDPKLSDALGTNDSSDHWVTGSRNTSLQVGNGGKIRAAGYTIGATATRIYSSDFTVTLASGTYANYVCWGDSPIWVDGVRRA